LNIVNKGAFIQRRWPRLAEYGFLETDYGGDHDGRRTGNEGCFPMGRWAALKDISWTLVLLCVGSSVTLWDQRDLIPHHFVSGGVTGLALRSPLSRAGPLRRVDLCRHECALSGRLVFSSPVGFFFYSVAGATMLFRSRRLGGSRGHFRLRTASGRHPWPASSWEPGRGIILKSLGSRPGPCILSGDPPPAFLHSPGTTRLPQRPADE